jgi:hypothetical protein
VDGAASEDHWDTARKVGELLKTLKLKEPGREGTFGSLAFSHEILHQIGGEDDSNRNTSRRILLLLESIAFGSPDAYNRVTGAVLKRYLSEDDAFLAWRSEKPIPRFLLNDFSRFWWTMAVDFAYKRRSRMGQGAVIRNLKLRMSRKLIYAAGLLACFSLALDEQSAKRLKEAEKEGEPVERVKYFRDLLAKPPLEILAEHVLRHKNLDRSAKKLFDAYDLFLDALSDKDKRQELESLDLKQANSSAVYNKVRQATHDFRDALTEIFFDEESGVADLTIRYGVF